MSFPRSQPIDNPTPFLAGGGELGELIARFDWAGTSLGPLSAWKQPLTTTLGLILRSPAPIVTLWGEDGVMIYNDAYAVFSAGRHPQLLGSRVREGWPEVASFNDNVMRVGLAGGILSYKNQELTLHRKGGPEQVWMDLNYSPIRDDAGRPVGVIAIVLDRSDEHRAQDANARDRDRIWTLSPILKVVADTRQTVTKVNPAWEKILGWSETESIGKDLLGFVAAEDRATASAVLANSRDVQLVEDQQLALLAKDGGTRQIAWTLVRENGIVYGFGRDVTDQRATEEALRQSQKMEAVGQLTGGIAHDFNNLLQGITGSLDLVQKRIMQGRNNELERFIGGAMTSANRAAALTHRLLAFSRRQPLDPRPVQANPLMTSMEDLLRRTLGEGIQLELVLAGGLWLTKCDANQLESSVLNLAINARDAMPDGGKLTIETCNAHLDGAYAAKQRDVRPGQYICICVTDTGTGMDAQTVSKAFDPFFTTKPIGQGTGLGLSMIYGFARQSEGYAKIYSEPGKGTTVKLYLPRYRGAVEEHESLPQLTDAHLADANEAVLVIEDEPVVRALIVEVLSELGYRALEAHDGPSGVEILRSPRRIDLLITDIGLPGMNGRQVAEAGRELRPDLKVLFMTGYAENAAFASGFLEPGMSMITKPFAMEVLATRIRRIIEDR